MEECIPWNKRPILEAKNVRYFGPGVELYSVVKYALLPNFDPYTNICIIQMNGILSLDYELNICEEVVRENILIRYILKLFLGWGGQNRFVSHS